MVVFDAASWEEEGSRFLESLLIWLLMVSTDIVLVLQIPLCGLLGHALVIFLSDSTIELPRDGWWEAGSDGPVLLLLAGFEIPQNP